MLDRVVTPNGTTRVVIDARLRSGEMGGIESVLIGLASGLSNLTDGFEEYVFVTWQGLGSWLEPHVHGRAGIIEGPLPPWMGGAPPPPTLRQRIGALVPPVRALWRRRPPYLGPPRSDPFIEALNPDVIHFPFQSGFITPRPTIFHPHDLQHVHLPQFFTQEALRHRELWYGLLSRQAALVAVASEWTRRDVMQHFRLASDKVRVVPFAPPIDAFAEPSPAAIEEVRGRLAVPEAFILYPAQTWPHKNHIGLLEALSILRSRGMTIPLVAPGQQTDFFPAIANRAADLGVAEQVHWLGFVAPSDLRALYAAARAVVIPSLFEAASAPLWEAFRAGVPAACSNVTSLPDQAGDAALVFDASSPEAIARAIDRLWSDDVLRGTLADAGRLKVAGLTWDRSARTFRAHYRRLAGRPLDEQDQGLLSAKAPI